MADVVSLLPYQEIGAQWLAPRPQALLADDMGLGKSAQAIRAADMVGARDVLVLCPASVKANWEREWEKFSPMDRPCHIFFSSDEPIPAWHGVFICSYDLIVVPSTAKAKKRIALLERDAEIIEDFEAQMAAAKDTLAQMKALNKRRKAFLRALYARRWDLLIVDEAHYLKDDEADRTRRVYGYNTQNPGFVQRATRTWRLTGTPAPNNYSELFTHIRSMGAATEPYWDFVFRYCTGLDEGFGFKITGSKNTDELKQRLAPYMLRRKKEDVLPDLPEIFFQTVTVERSKVVLDYDFFEQYVDLPGGQQELLRKIEEQDRLVRAGMDAAKSNQDKLAFLEGLAPSMVTLRRYIGMAKLPAMLDIIEEELVAKAYPKIVLFANHKCVINATRERLRKFGAVTLYGETPPEKRINHIDRFMHDPKCKVFVGNIIAAGTGINLTVANEMAFLEQDWVPANNAQAAMRIHRIGQTKKVRVRIFSLRGSVDDRIQDVLYRKMYDLSKIF